MMLQALHTRVFSGFTTCLQLQQAVDGYALALGGSLGPGPTLSADLHTAPPDLSSQRGLPCSERKP